MASIQRSIEVNVPLHSAYQQLARFEDYPRFMEGVQEVRRLDDTHLRWHAKGGGKNDESMQWDAEITKQVPDQCIAWRNADGPVQGGTLQLRPLDASKTSVSVEFEFARQDGAAEDQDDAIAGRVEQDLARFKKLVEGELVKDELAKGELTSVPPVSDFGAATAPAARESFHESVHESAAESMLESDGTRAREHEKEPHDNHLYGYSGEDGSDGQATPVSSYAAGAEGWDGNEDPGVALSVADPAMPQGDAPASFAPQQAASTQSAASLSKSAGAEAEDESFRVAEEQSFDQQSAQARRVGRMPEGRAMPGTSGDSPAEAMKQSLHEDKRPASGSGPSQQQEPPRKSRAERIDASWLPNFLQRWEEPRGVIRRVSGEMDQIFEKFVGRPIDELRARRGNLPGAAHSGAPEGSWSPVLEVAQHDNEFTICAELPGVKLEDVQVEVRRDKLIIEGERQRHGRQGAEGYRRSERSYGHFYRAVPLPEGVDTDAASAAMHDGLLEITLPVSAHSAPGKRLDIKPAP